MATVETSVRKRSRKINLMLSRDYCKNWDLFHGVREFYANALDADPNCLVDFPTNDCIRITTKTRPSLTQMFVMGAGTKDGSNTIGQFGEGAKVGALTLARRRNTTLVISLSDQSITYEFDTPAGFDVPLLHAVIAPPLPDAPEDDGCVISIGATAVKELFLTHFLKPQTGFGPLIKVDNAKGMRVFCRGILIKRLDESSFFDWNLEHLQLNRDRDMPNYYDLKFRVGQWVNKLVVDDETFARRVLRSPDMFESRSFESINVTDSARAAMAQAFRQINGDNAMIACNDTSTNSLAAARGHKPVIVPAHLSSVLMFGEGIKRADSVRTISDTLTELSNPPSLTFLKPVLDAIGIPCEIHVFDAASAPRKLLGKAERSGNSAVVWLSSSLFEPGQRLELCRTLCHEIGHIKGGDDATTEFEWSLDFVAGKLAETLLIQAGTN